ncbi:MAG: type VI secretion system tip protein VgrG [Azoarcus sp.]|jgi:type VI secretion system secreted protein VgrG|nr:type VI secretion system tip protein VgrG [Azoarcus sp.]
MNRLLVAHTPLGALWWATSLGGTEALSDLYAFTLVLESKQSGIDGQSLIGEVCAVELEAQRGVKRHFSGQIVKVSACSKEDRHWKYVVSIAPKLWHASRRADFRIWQNKSVPEITDEVLQQNALRYEWRLKNPYRKWEYLVQYGETDLNFLSRLFEHEGIYYWFEHGPGGETLILGDHFSTHEPFGGYESIPFYSPDVSRPDEDHYSEWSVSREPEPGRYQHRDYDFKQPSKEMTTEFVDPRGHLFDQYEIYDYPGNYIEPSDGTAYATARLEALQSQQDIIQLVGRVRGATPGTLFTLNKHPVVAFNREYMITRAHYAASNSDYEGAGKGDEAYFNVGIEALPADRQYRSLPKTPKPRTRGPETAVVVGPAGSEIHTDQYGRVKVHFHWDRYGKKDGEDSCWIRVSYPWAGSKFGGINIPRIGQEVIVDHEYGDPDRPFITGRVYNAQQMPPWELPANKTQSGLMSRSSPGGGSDNTNAIRFEDAKGKEEMWVRAERNRRLEVKKDESTWIGNDRTQQVDGEHVEKVKKDISVSSGANISYLAKGGIMLEAGTQIEFKVGPSSIVMTENGKIRIHGPARVNINEKPAGTTPAYSTATDLAAPAAPADAPAIINFTNMQSNFSALWNNSFPGGVSQEQGGTIVSDASGSLSIVNMQSGTSGSFSPDFNVGPDQTIQGIFHTHPYDASEGGHTGVSFSGGDAANLINDHQRSISVVQSGEEQFMLMRTAATPASVDSTKLSSAHSARMAELVNTDGLSFSDASRAATRETAKAYGLAYYEGSDGVLQRVYP